MRSANAFSSQRGVSLLQGVKVIRDAESYNAIIDDKLYLGNLSAAGSPQLLTRLKITHVLSVCPDIMEVVETIKHLTLPIVDDEQFELLQYLSATCQFIQEALDSGGHVLVHCVMGISRSAAVVSAYLMFSQHISAARAIALVRSRRPKSKPSYNFIRQLQVFGECNCDIGLDQPSYMTWQKRQKFDKTNSIRVIDAMVILSDQLFLSFDFPSDMDRAAMLFEHLGITHIVSITPDAFSGAGAILENRLHKHFIVPYTSKESLLLALPSLCQFVNNAMQVENSRIIVHCMDELRGGIAICAYLMFSRHVTSTQALEILQEQVPLFDDNPALLGRHLELFEQCQHAPTQRHPLVRAWVSGPFRSQT
ncbi:protein-tyrosine phosphatase-like protein [Mycena sanguinolenta]|nr:protein-tyrosine phosphatase-like protein [Mycena sanguinolenta]